MSRQKQYRRNPQGKRTDERPTAKMPRRDVYRDEAKNDISWYSRYPNLLIAAGSFPYPYRPGSTLNMGQVSNGAATPAYSQAKMQVPGVMALSWMPSVGISNYATDPVSVACKEIYAKVRQVYSGSLDADAPDFMMYLMSLDSIFSYIAYLKRIYRLITSWSPDNYVIPDGILKAMGLADSVINTLRLNKTQLWQAINTLVLQSHKFTCPAVMDIFNRHYWMSDNVYTDASTINSQFYIFNLVALYQFANMPIPGDESNTAAGLQMIAMPNFGSSTTNVSTLLDFGLSLINALVAWDDAYTINGYLSRAFEGVPSFRVDEISVDDKLLPVYEEEVLMQIENSRTVPCVWLQSTNYSGMSVAQNPLTNAVISNPTIAITAKPSSVSQDKGAYTRDGYKLNPYLSVRSDSPTVADSVVASRLQCWCEAVVDGNNLSFKVHAGTEIPLYWTTNGTLGAQRVEQMCVYSNAESIGASDLLALMELEAYDWHPFVMITTILSNRTVTGPLGDVHNITVISQDDLTNLHTVCLYSEFNAFAI